MITDVVILTPTCDRHAQVASVMRAVQAEKVSLDALLKVEHFVIADGHDDAVQGLCLHYGAVYLCTPRRVGDWGKTPLDLGIRESWSEYLMFWDDDNIYERGAIERHYRISKGYDLGVCPIDFWDRKNNRMLKIPQKWDGQFRYGQIDTANVCVRREFLENSGLTCAGVANGEYGSDFWLYKSLLDQGATVNYCDKHHVATHI